MAWDHNRVKQVNTIVKLEQANQEKYCWPSLYLMAVETDSEERLSYKEQAKNDVQRCKSEAENMGRCWCGKIIKAERGLN